MAADTQWDALQEQLQDSHDEAHELLLTAQTLIEESRQLREENYRLRRRLSRLRDAAQGPTRQ